MRIPDIVKIAPVILKSSQESLCITGAPGVGKTSICAEIADALDADLLIQHPAYDEPVDYKGLPAPHDNGHGKVMHWYAPDNLPLERIYDGKRNLLWVLDDIGQAHPQVQNALARTFHSMERVIAGRKLDERVYVIATTNRIEDAAAVFEMPSFARMRVSFLDLEVTAQDWCQWAYKAKDVPEEFISFLHPNGKMGGSKHIFDFEPARRTNCSPRTLHIAGKHWANLKDFDESVVDEAMGGIVCPAFPMELRAHLKLYAELPDINDILEGKHVSMEFAKRPDLLYLVNVSLVKRAKLEHTSAIAAFILQLPKNRVDFAAMLFKEAKTKLLRLGMERDLQKWILEHKQELVG
jgi:hypothetical protein